MKKILITTLLICGLFSSLTNVHVHAATPSTATPYAVSYPCPNCGGMVVRSTRKTLDSSYQQNCVHGKTGKDTVKVYKVYDEDNCNSCSFYELTYVSTQRTVVCNAR